MKMFLWNSIVFFTACQLTQFQACSFVWYVAWILHLWSLRSLFVQLENHLNYISMLNKCVHISFHWVDKPQSFLFAAFLLRLVVHLLLFWIYRLEMESLSHSGSSLLMFEPFWLLRWLFLGDCGIFTLVGDLSGEPMGLLLLLHCMVK